MQWPWQQRWHVWLAKRFHFIDAKQLTQRDILIFIYQQGYLFVSLIVLSFVAGVNYANNLILGFCFLISAVLCISFYITFKQLHGLKVELLIPEIGQVEQTLKITVLLQQSERQVRYLYLQYADQIKPFMVTDKQQQFDLDFIPEQRGRWQLPIIKLYSVYPLGLVRAWHYLYVQHDTWIAPKALSHQYESDYSLLKSAQDWDEFHELREFKLGDRLQAVSWKHAAQGQGLQVKVFEQQQTPPELSIDYTQLGVAEHEQKLALMMGLIEQCEFDQRAYSLKLPQQQLGFGVGEQQLRQAKKLLAQA